MRYAMGIDGGGTKTRCVIADEKGNILGQSIGGPSNHITEGDQGLKSRRVLKNVVKKASRKAGIFLEDIDVVSVALAGIGLLARSKVIEDILSEVIPIQKVIQDNDAVAALVGAVLEQYGIVVIAGTGAIAVGIDKAGNRIRSGGWGHILGDEGSGFDIGRRGIIAAVRSYDGRGEDTLLIEKTAEYFNVESLDELRRVIYKNPLDRTEIAGFARCVIDAANTGDKLSVDILNIAGRELGLAASAVIRRLDLENENFKLAPCGG